MNLTSPSLILATACVLGCGQNDSYRQQNPTNNFNPAHATPQNLKKGGGAVQAAEDAIIGLSVNPEDYGVSKEEVFEVFKAKIQLLTNRLKSGPASERAIQQSISDFRRLVGGMERTDTNHPATVEARAALRELEKR
jgi:hypothetical protein